MCSNNHYQENVSQMETLRVDDRSLASATRLSNILHLHVLFVFNPNDLL